MTTTTTEKSSKNQTKGWVWWCMLMMRFKKWQHHTMKLLRFQLLVPSRSRSFHLSLLIPSLFSAFRLGCRLRRRLRAVEPNRAPDSQVECANKKRKTSKDRLRVNMVTLAFSDFWALNGSAVCDEQIRTDLPAEKNKMAVEKKGQKNEIIKWEKKIFDWPHLPCLPKKTCQVSISTPWCLTI